MRKLIFSIQVSLDGFIDHTEMIADEEAHQYAADQLRSADTILFGRATYQLLADYWPTVVTNASRSGSRPLTQGEIEFAHQINSIPKIVFSKTLENVGWNTQLVKAVIPEDILEMKRQPGKDLLIAGAGLATTLSKLGLVDEYEFLVQPIILGKGRLLFRDIKDRIKLKLVETKTFRNGVVLLHYQPEK